MINDETVKYLAANFDVRQLLAAFLCHEIPFRLEEVHNLTPDKIEQVKDELIAYFYTDSDSMFNYDAIDTIISSYLETKGCIKL